MDFAGIYFRDLVTAKYFAGISVKILVRIRNESLIEYQFFYC